MRRSVLFTLVIGIFLIFPSCSEQFSNQWELTSPSEELKLIVSLNDSGEIRYQLKNGERSVIEESPMGMEFHEASFVRNLEMISETKYINRKDNYTLFTGKRVENQISWNEKQLKFSNEKQQEMLISFRLFDDGLAFQY
ncbi:MAG: glycoside hydrolase family 97 N-terminal domain-containing protein, partial [Bacteroidota bacterium]